MSELTQPPFDTREPTRPAKIRQTVDTSPSDQEYVSRFMEQVRTLAGCVREAFEENKVMLLSPYMRELIAEKAREVERMQLTLSGRLVADNPCEDFK